MGIADIDVFGTGLTFPGANFTLTGSPTDPWLNTRQSPFGGQVVIQGYPTVGSKYRVWVQESGSPFPTMLTSKIWTVDMWGVGTWTSPDPSGFFTYLDITQNIDNTLAYWYYSGDSLWQVWLEIANSSDVVVGSTLRYNVQLDNTAPTVQIHIDSGGDCKDFTVDTSVDGHFVAQDANFGYFSLSTLPNNPPAMPSNTPTTATANTSETAAPPGDAWSPGHDEPSGDGALWLRGPPGGVGHRYRERLAGALTTATTLQLASASAHQASRRSAGSLGGMGSHSSRPIPASQILQGFKQRSGSLSAGPCTALLVESGRAANTSQPAHVRGPWQRNFSSAPTLICSVRYQELVSVGVCNHSSQQTSAPGISMSLGSIVTDPPRRLISPQAAAGSGCAKTTPVTVPGFPSFLAGELDVHRQYRRRARESEDRPGPSSRRT